MNIQSSIDALATAAVYFHSIGSFDKSRICKDIEQKLRQFGTWASPRQQRYAQFLCGEADRARLAPHVAAVEATTTISESAMQRIHALFNMARGRGLLRPKIFVSVNRTKIILKPESAIERGIYILDANKRFQGRITPDNVFVPHSRCTAEIRAAVQEFGDDPIRIARAHGHRTGNCCFCSRDLTDGRSVAVGYGPTCASNYNLPWGEERLVSDAVILPSAVEAVIDERIVSARVPQSLVQIQRAALPSIRMQAHSSPPLVPMTRYERQEHRAEPMRAPPSLQYEDEDDQFFAPRTG